VRVIRTEVTLVVLFVLFARNFIGDVVKGALRG
jgi:hypothetical protein